MADASLNANNILDRSLFAGTPVFSETLSADRDGNVYTNISLSVIVLAPHLAAQNTPVGPRFMIGITPPIAPSTPMAVHAGIVQSTPVLPSNFSIGRLPGFENDFPDIGRLPEREGELVINVNSLDRLMWDAIESISDGSLGLGNYSSTPNVELSGTIEAMPGTTRGYSVNILTSEAATNAISIFDNALNIISNERAGFGATINRLEHTAQSLGISSENLSDAESRVRNADMAREMMDFMQMNVLFDAGMLMLAQANQLPNTILQLLQN